MRRTPTLRRTRDALTAASSKKSKKQGFFFFFTPKLAVRSAFWEAEGRTGGGEDLLRRRRPGEGQGGKGQLEKDTGLRGEALQKFPWFPLCVVFSLRDAGAHKGGKGCGCIEQTPVGVQRRK